MGYKITDWKKKKKKDALSLLKAVQKKIENGELEVRNSGQWNSHLGGRMSVHVDLTNLDQKDEEDS